MENESKIEFDFLRAGEIWGIEKHPYLRENGARATEIGTGEHSGWWSSSAYNNKHVIIAMIDGTFDRLNAQNVMYLGRPASRSLEIAQSRRTGRSGKNWYETKFGTHITRSGQELDILWEVDGETGRSFTRDLFLRHIAFNKDGTYDGNFKKTTICEHMNGIWAKQIMPKIAPIGRGEEKRKSLTFIQRFPQFFYTPEEAEFRKRLNEELRR